MIKFLFFTAISSALLFLPLWFNQNTYAQTNSSSIFREYTNPDYHVKLQYPANWTVQEVGLTPEQVVFFFPREIVEECPNLAIDCPVGFEVFVRPTTFVNISEMAIGARNHYKQNAEFRLISDRTNATLANLPAYESIGYNYEMGDNVKIIELVTIFDQEMFDVAYYADPGYFNIYLPIAREMMDSFEITR
jgi:hypothetical protein